MSLTLGDISLHDMIMEECPLRMMQLPALFVALHLRPYGPACTGRPPHKFSARPQYFPLSTAPCGQQVAPQVHYTTRFMSRRRATKSTSTCTSTAGNTSTIRHRKVRPRRQARR